MLWKGWLSKCKSKWGTCITKFSSLKRSKKVRMSQEHDTFYSVTKCNTSNTSLHRCVNQNTFRIWRVHLSPYCSKMNQVMLSLYIIKHHTMTTDGGSRGIAPHIFASALDGSGEIYAPLPPRYPLDRRLGWPKSQTERCDERNVLPLPGIDSRFLGHASRHT
jgi:hypothetical protein